MDAKIQQNAIPRACNIEDIFSDFKGRRAGLLRAFTTDVFEFYMNCDPDKESLRLYGLPDEQWEVIAPGDEKELYEIPPPALGINFVRNSMSVGEWISTVALHSDSWLIAVAFYYAGKSGFDEADRERLFHMINDLPTLSEILAGKEAEKVKDAPSPKCEGGHIVPKHEEDGSDQDKDEEDGEEDEDEGDEAHA